MPVGADAPERDGSLLKLTETYGFDYIPVACGADSWGIDALFLDEDDDDLEPAELY